jgi:thiamine pyrophosphokinase
MREDHTLGNISLLADYAPLFNRIEILTDYGLFTPLRQTTTLKSSPGQQISLFSLYPEGKITTENLRWPITNRLLTSWWQGTLNEALTDSFTIRMEGDGRVIVFRNQVNVQKIQKD